MGILSALILVVIVSIIASVILTAMNKGEEKKDKGFAFSYQRLSHRRRLIRTFWMLPITVLVLIGLRQLDIMTQFEWNAVVTIFAIVFVSQALYEYWKWKKGEKEAV